MNELNQRILITSAFTPLGERLGHLNSSSQ